MAFEKSAGPAAEKPEPKAPQPKLFKVTIAAHTASDANGRAYNNYCILDPLKFWQRRQTILGLNATPRALIGSSEDVLPPQAQKRNTIALPRGGEPVDIIVCEEQLKQLKSDRKNLNVFRAEQITDPKVKLGLLKPLKLEQSTKSEEPDDLDPK